jgi:TonB family protein
MTATKRFQLIGVLLSWSVVQCTNTMAQTAPAPTINTLAKPLNTLPPTVLPGTCKLSALLEANSDQATEGKFSAQFDVGPDGAVLGIKIFKTTGSAKLNTASLTALQACRFAPGSEEGKAARTTALLEVEWKPGAEPKVFAFDIYAPWRKRP